MSAAGGSQAAVERWGPVLSWEESRRMAGGLRRAREAAGLRQAEVAAAAGLSATTVGHIERGARRLYSGQAEALARAAGTTAEALAAGGAA